MLQLNWIRLLNLKLKRIVGETYLLHYLNVTGENMNAQKKLNEIAEKVLTQLDNLGFQLDTMGVENQINRHNLIALIMFGQKRLEGELDSINAKIDTGKAKVEGILDSAEKLVVSAGNLAIFPAKYTLDRVKSQL
jgi:hypothetical protein